MDFVKILRSLEEALYEAMSWLVFYPITLWMVLRHPQKAMAYSDAEQRDKPEHQYLDTLSPPLFLLLSLLLGHGLSAAMNQPAPELETQIGTFIYGSMQNLVVFQALVFSLHPLLYAVALLRCTGRKIDRESLKAPFFAQCYLSGATAILVNLSATGMQFGASWSVIGGVVLLLAATLWYLFVQQQWFRKQDRMSGVKAMLVAVGVFAASAVLMVAAFLVVTLGAPAKVV